MTEQDQLYRWEFWQGVSGLYYARLRGSSPPVILKAACSLDIADRVLLYLSCPDRALRWEMVRHDSIQPNLVASHHESEVRQTPVMPKRPQESSVVPIRIDYDQDQYGS